MSDEPQQSTSLVTGETVEVTAQALDPEGFGVGAVRGVEVCAGDLLPGETAVVRLEHVSPHRPRAWGQVVERIGVAAAERIPPVCPAFGRCGGCTWQHLAYPAQLQHKSRRVDTALDAANVPRRGVGVAALVNPIIGAPRTEGYRNVAKYVARHGDSRLILGAYAPRTHEVVDTRGCRVVEPVIDRVRQAACAALARLPVYDEQTGRGLLRYVVIRTGGRGQALVVVVTTRSGGAHDAKAIDHAAAEIADHPEVSGVVWLQNDATSGVILAGEAKCLAGRQSVTEVVAGVAIDVEVGDFFQVNRTQAARLYAEVTRLAGRFEEVTGQPIERIIDVYCGVGGVGFALAAAVPNRRVLGIERNPGAVLQASAAATRAGMGDRVQFRAGDAAHLTAFSAEVYGREGADLVVVNPPRKGLHEDTRAALHILGPPHVIYVSCSPDSLARDLAEFGKAHYHVDEIAPIDLMPGTPQVETVIALTHL